MGEVLSFIGGARGGGRRTQTNSDRWGSIGRPLLHYFSLSRAGGERGIFWQSFSPSFPPILPGSLGWLASAAPHPLQRSQKSGREIEVGNIRRGRRRIPRWGKKEGEDREKGDGFGRGRGQIGSVLASLSPDSSSSSSLSRERLRFLLPLLRHKQDKLPPRRRHKGLPPFPPSSCEFSTHPRNGGRRRGVHFAAWKKGDRRTLSWETMRRRSRREEMATRLRLGGLVGVGKSNRSSSFPPAIEAEALLGCRRAISADIIVPPFPLFSSSAQPPSPLLAFHPISCSRPPPPLAAVKGRSEKGGRESANSRLPSSSRLGVKSDKMKRPDLIPTFFCLLQLSCSVPLANV